MLAVISLPWDAWGEIKKFPPERYAELRTAIPHLGLPDDQTATYWSSSDTVVDLDDITALTSFGLKPTLKRMKGVQYPVHPSVAPQTPISLVATTGVSLFQVQRVRVLEDCCTDELQGELNSGWRIIAVCPPNDTRRPTYVLGRVEP